MLDGATPIQENLLTVRPFVQSGSGDGAGGGDK